MNCPVGTEHPEIVLSRWDNHFFIGVFINILPLRGTLNFGYNEVGLFTQRLKIKLTLLKPTHCILEKNPYLYPAAFFQSNHFLFLS